jgi:hypothetical protein
LIFVDIQKLFIDYSKTAITLPDIYNGQDLSKQWTELLINSHSKDKIYTFRIIRYKKNPLDNSLLFEYTDHVNKELLSLVTNEIETFYKNVFRHMYKAVHPLDYFSNELISYLAILAHLSQWPVLVRVRKKIFY